MYTKFGLFCNHLQDLKKYFDSSGGSIGPKTVQVLSRANSFPPTLSLSHIHFLLGVLVLHNYVEKNDYSDKPYM